MKNEIKKVVYGISSAVLLLPVAKVSAAIEYGKFDPYVGDETNLPEGSIMEIAIGIMNWLLIAIGIAGVVGFAITGIMYLIAAGDDAKIKTAKAGMTACITGVIVAVAGVVALKAAKAMLGAEEF